MLIRLFLISTTILSAFYSQSQQTVQVGNTELNVREVTTGLDVPWEMKWGPDNFLWITEREGIVSRVNVATGQKNVILNIENVVWSSGESGLLGMEIHPDFNNGSPYVFLAYTYQDNGEKERISAFEYDETNDTLINETFLINDIPALSIHAGCRLLALDDMTMLITTGDAQAWMDSQDSTVLTGKTLRMSIDHANGAMGDIPADNPNPASYVWTYGHRNAQGLAVGPNGIIYSSEHGPWNDDELNILNADANYGWPNVQGFCDNLYVDLAYAEDLSANYQETDYCDDFNIVECIWSSGSTTIAPSDIIWYDNAAIPEFQNSLLMTVLKDRTLVRFTFTNNGTVVDDYTEFFEDEWGRLRDICVSPNGNIYLATNGTSWPSQPPNEIIELSPVNPPNSFNEGALPGIKVVSNENSYVITHPNYKASLMDATGRSIEFSSHSEDKIELVKGNFPSGVYFLRFSNGIAEQTIKLLF